MPGNGPHADSFLGKMPRIGLHAAAYPGNRTGNQSDLYRSIINNVLTVNLNARATDAWYLLSGMMRRKCTVENIDVEKAKSAGQLTSDQEEPGRSVPITDFTVKSAGQLTAAGKTDEQVPITDFTEKSAGQLTNDQEEPGRSVPITDFDNRLIQMLKSVKNQPQIPSNATDAWYRSVWNDAKKMYGKSNTHFQTGDETTLFHEDEDKKSRAQELDNRFYKEADRPIF